jgi:putative heme-binding domain-containing protein
MTDELIGEDGALYFVTGGRGTVADLFRVSYAGSEAAAPLPADQLRDSEGSAARALRHKLEALNVTADPTAVEVAWPNLNSPDRFIRYVARLAIERNPVEEWQGRALAEKRPEAAFTALLALARLGAADTQPAILKALSAFPSAALSEEQLLEKLRVIEVSIARQGLPTGDALQVLLADVDALYPAKAEFVNRELAQILISVSAPHVVARSVALITAATSQEEQLTYVVDLRNVKTGWNLDLRRTYLSFWDTGRSSQHPAYVVQWFTDAGINFNNGSSFKNLLNHALSDAKASLSSEEIAALGDLNKPQAAAKANLEARKFVKEWTTADLQVLLDQVSRGRDFARGKAGFEAGQCIMCHRYGEQGGSVGPDLTAVATRFKRQDILESITEPSKVVSEQYMNTIFTLKDGNVMIGRVIQDTDKTVLVAQNPFSAVTTPINKSDIKSRDLSKISPMPPGLLNTFTKEEILDLLAYLESMGDPKHPDFSK